MNGPSQVKILFQLTQDEDGYPPIQVEGVWALSAPDGADGYLIDNVPFFTRDATLQRLSVRWNTEAAV